MEAVAESMKFKVHSRDYKVIGHLVTIEKFYTKSQENFDSFFFTSMNSDGAHKIMFWQSQLLREFCSSI